MHFVYTPEGAEEPRLKAPFEPAKMLNVEAEVIERKTGMRFPEWSDAVLEGSMLALHGLLFVLLKREDPTITWDKIQFSAAECDFQMEDDELADLVARLRTQTNLTDAQIEFLDDYEARHAAQDEEADEESDPTETGESSTPEMSTD